MEEMMNRNQAKTDAKFKELTETIEKTQLELQTAEFSLDARTRKLQEDLMGTKQELQARLEAVETRTERGQQSAPVQLRHQYSMEVHCGACSGGSSRS
jgi:hypothetical protein